MGQGNARIYNIVSLVFVLLTIGAIVLVVSRMVQPPAVVETVAQALPTQASLPSVTPTFTPSLTSVPTETFTPTATFTPSETPIPPTGTFTDSPTLTPSQTFTPTPLPSNTPVPSETPIPSPTPLVSNTPLPPTAIPSDTITPTLPFTATPFPTPTTPPPTVGFTPIPTSADVPSPYPFALRDAQPIFSTNFANTAGCAWQGIGGQVFDVNDAPLLGVTVHVFGPGVDARVNSGTNTIYGTSGWEVPLGNTLTGNSYRVELLSPAGTIISPQIVVTFTLNDCARNLALLNFKQSRPF